MGNNSNLRIDSHELFLNEMRLYLYLFSHLWYSIFYNFNFLTNWSKFTCTQLLQTIFPKGMFSALTRETHSCNDPKEIKYDTKTVEPCWAFPGVRLLRPKNTSASAAAQVTLTFISSTYNLASVNWKNAEKHMMKPKWKQQFPLNQSGGTKKLLKCKKEWSCRCWKKAVVTCMFYKWNNPVHVLSWWRGYLMGLSILSSLNKTELPLKWSIEC